MQGATVSATFIQSVAFAAEKHRTQRRKDLAATPYINHPIEVANVLRSEAGIDDEAVLCAAILHDTIEDTATTKQELEAAFGPLIAGIVEEVTDDKRLEKADRKRLQVEHAAGLSRQAKLVKLADKICNLRDCTGHPPANWSPSRLRQYFDWAEAVAAGLRGVHPRLDAIFDMALVNKP